MDVPLDVFIQRCRYEFVSEHFSFYLQDGVVNATDLDKLMTYGLGRRYALIGALEASHLNAFGLL